MNSERGKGNTSFSCVGCQGLLDGDWDSSLQASKSIGKLSIEMGFFLSVLSEDLVVWQDVESDQMETWDTLHWKDGQSAGFGVIERRDGGMQRSHGRHGRIKVDNLA